eukprot:6917787-Prymnesium_polylepis.1
MCIRDSVGAAAKPRRRGGAGRPVDSPAEPIYAYVNGAWPTPHHRCSVFHSSSPHNMKPMMGAHRSSQAA